VGSADDFDADRDTLDRVRDLVAEAFAVGEATRRDAVDALRLTKCSSALLPLVHDGLESRDPPREHETSPDRVLLFRGHGLAVEVRVRSTGDWCDLVGRLRPPRPCSVSVVNPQQRIDVPAEGAGRFRARRIPRRPSTVLLRVDDGSARQHYRTAWTAL
jgi:hypothetical protein